VDLSGVSKVNIKMKITEAEEWAIHNRATQVVFSLDDLSTVQRYNKKLNNHERVTEYAESLGAEMVVARYFGLDYDINVSKGKREADVGQGLEVKWTSYINGSLIVYPNERVQDIAVLVVGRSPEYYIVGWLPVKDAMQKHFKNGTQESWWVNQEHLAPIGDLVRSSYASTHI
jgi:hypothetical protein